WPAPRAPRPRPKKPPGRRPTGTTAGAKQPPASETEGDGPAQQRSGIDVSLLDDVSVAIQHADDALHADPSPEAEVEELDGSPVDPDEQGKGRVASHAVLDGAVRRE